MQHELLYHFVLSTHPIMVLYVISRHGILRYYSSFCTSFRHHRVIWSLSLVSLHDHFEYCMAWAEPH